MKFYKKVLPLLALTGIVLAGCGAQSHHASHQSSEQTQSQAMAPRKSQVKRDLSNDKNGAKQQHYSNQTQAKQGLQKKINRQPQVSQAVQEQKNVTSSSSSSSSASQEPGAVDLGHGITGHQDRGAGQTYVSFKMGRWQIIVHGNDVNEKASSAVQKAKQLVDYFQSHTLPIPSSQGIVQVDLSDGSTRVSWDQNNKVNTLNGKLDATLQKAVSLK